MPTVFNDNTSNTNYIDTLDYKELQEKLTKLKGVIDDNEGINRVARRMRYADVEVRAEQASGKLAPDELYIPQHIIDTNIRREQSSYVQFVVQSPRAAIFKDNQEPARDCTVIENDFTAKVRYNGYQIPMFSNIDGMQQNGYGMLEVVLDTNLPGELGHEFVPFGDFAFPEDTKDIQDAEFVMRNYYFSKTKLVEMCAPDSPWKFSKEQVDKVIAKEPPSTDLSTTSSRDKSLYKIQKVMFRVRGTVYVAWCSPQDCDDWLRVPQALYLGDRKVVTQMDAMGQEVPVPDMQLNPMTGQLEPTGLPKSEEIYETDYPYVPFPYLISENGTLSMLKGRVFLDQDAQQAATSLISTYCTAARRAAQLMFAKDGDDPNTIMQDENAFFKPGVILKQKVKQFQLNYPGAELVTAAQAIVSNNQNETSQVNFAVQNRQDSRKTATEVSAAAQEQSKLTTVQVVLFSNSLRTLYQLMFRIMQSRVTCGLIKVSPELMELYGRSYTIKPSGDVDVIQRQEEVQHMMNAWGVVQNSAIAGEFFVDMMSKMFPEQAAKYTQLIRNAIQQAQQQQMMQQQAQQNGMSQLAMHTANGVVELANNPNYFSDEGKLHAFPVVKRTAEQIQQAMNGQPQQRQ